MKEKVFVEDMHHKQLIEKKLRIINPFKEISRGEDADS